MKLVFWFLNYRTFKSLRNRTSVEEDDLAFLVTKDGTLPIHEQTDFNHYQYLLVVCKDLEPKDKPTKIYFDKFEVTAQILSNKLSSIKTLFTVLHARINDCPITTKQDQQQLSECIQKVFNTLKNDMHFEDRSLDSLEEMDHLLDFIHETACNHSFNQLMENFIQAIFNTSEATQKMECYIRCVQVIQKAPKHKVGEQVLNQIWEEQKPFPVYEAQEKWEKLLEIKNTFDQKLDTDTDQKAALRYFESALAELLNIN